MTERRCEICGSLEADCKMWVGWVCKPCSAIASHMLNERVGRFEKDALYLTSCGSPCTADDLRSQSLQHFVTLQDQWLQRKIAEHTEARA